MNRTHSTALLAAAAAALMAGCTMEFVRPDGFECALQPTLSGSTLSVNEHCPGQGAPEQVNHDVAQVEGGAGWHRFTITVDFAAKSFDVSIKMPSGAVGALRSTPLDKRSAELRPGIAGDGHPCGRRDARLRLNCHGSITRTGDER